MWPGLKPLLFGCLAGAVAPVRPVRPAGRVNDHVFLPAPARMWHVQNRPHDGSECPHAPPR
jgi:hypothetical protein